VKGDFRSSSGVLGGKEYRNRYAVLVLYIQVHIPDPGKGIHPYHADSIHVQIYIYLHTCMIYIFVYMYDMYDMYEYIGYLSNGLRSPCLPSTVQYIQKEGIILRQTTQRLGPKEVMKASRARFETLRSRVSKCMYLGI
jgi:hypothetical protein